MLNPIVYQNIKFIQKALQNTKSYAAIKLAENEITREEYEEVCEYVEKGMGSMQNAWVDFDRHDYEV